MKRAVKRDFRTFHPNYKRRRSVARNMHRAGVPHCVIALVLRLPRHAVETVLREPEGAFFNDIKMLSVARALGVDYAAVCRDAEQFVRECTGGAA